jgi:hypothetical protein
MIIHLEGSDEPISVSADQVQLEDNDPYLAQDELDGIIQSRLSRQERTLRKELKEDDAFFHDAAEARGIELREDGRPKGSIRDEELQELRRKASLADSLQEENETLLSEQQETRRARLHTEALKTADGLHSGAQDDYLAAIEREMTYDDEFGWVAAEGDEIRYEAGQPLTVDQVANEIRERKPYFFKSTEMTGGPSDDPGSSNPVMNGTQFQKEVQKAAASGNRERLNELEEMAAENKIAD